MKREKLGQSATTRGRSEFEPAGSKSHPSQPLGKSSESRISGKSSRKTVHPSARIRSILASLLISKNTSSAASAPRPTNPSSANSECRHQDSVKNKSFSNFAVALTNTMRIHAAAYLSWHGYAVSAMYACNKFVNSIWGKAPRRTLFNNVSKKLRNLSAIGPKTGAVSYPKSPKRLDFHHPRTFRLFF